MYIVIDSVRQMRVDDNEFVYLKEAKEQRDSLQELYDNKLQVIDIKSFLYNRAKLNKPILSENNE